MPKRRLILPVLAVLVVVVAVVFLPPATRTLAVEEEIPEPVRGVIHVHTSRSDGSGSIEQVAAAAAAANLQFVVLADHGDGSRGVERPRYVGGVLCIDGVEVSTYQGHVLALGLVEKTPYLLGGEARDVVEDIARLGGFSIAAHPDSARPGLRWDGWELPVDGVEWLNADSAWRDESAWSLGRALLGYAWRRPQALATLLDRPVETLERWDRATAERPVVALAAADAHANLGVSETGNRFGDRALLAVPGYEPVFRTFSVALPGVALSGDAVDDARAVLGEIRNGRVYTTIDALATPGRLAVTGASGQETAVPGEVLGLSGPVAIRVRSTAPPDARVRLLKDGREIAAADGASLDFDGPAERGAYRVEVALPGADDTAAPWIVSNPIYAGGFPDAPEPARAVPKATVTAWASGPDEEIWQVEQNEQSNTALGATPLVKGTRRRLRFALGGSTQDQVYAALVMRVGPDPADYDRIIVRGGADRPLRVWLQLSTTTPTGTHAWRRSLYLDQDVRDIAVGFEELSPVDDAPAEIPLSAIASVRFVVDTTNTPLGSSGQVWVDDVRFGAR